MFSKAAVVTLPRLEPHRPPVSSAIIAAVCESAGVTAESFDLNIDFFHVHRQLFDGMDAILDGYRQPTEQESSIIDAFLDRWVARLWTHQPDIILISIFSYTTHFFAKRLLIKLQNHPAIKLIGGQGVYVPELSRQESDRNTFGQSMLDQGLVDHYVVGEGELTLKKFLAGQRQIPGLDNAMPAQVTDLDSLPWPDYSKFDLDRYQYLEDSREVFITSSRGCVRRCTYCDVPYHWPKYRWRSGKNVADEIIHHYELHGVKRFYFTDSLVNGNMKSFADMCDKLASYKFDPGISWSGQAIIKPQHQITDEYFDMIAAAGGRQFYIGVETGSDKVRWDMDKKFTNTDIDYHLQQFSRVGIKMFFLMLTGYVTETLKDHADTMDMFPRWQRYVADGTIAGIDLGPTLIILANTPLDDMRTDLGLHFVNQDPKSWVASANPDLTIRERIRRRLEIHERAIQYNWPVWRGQQRLETVRDLAQGLLGNKTSDKGIRSVNGAFD